MNVLASLQHKRDGKCVTLTTVSVAEMDEAGSASCPMAGFGISAVEPSGSVTRDLVS
jgi:hypothetical protein